MALVDTWTAQQAGERLGLSPRRVRVLAPRLKGQRDEFGHWHFDPAVVEAYADELAAAKEEGKRADPLAARVADLERRVDELERGE